MAEGDALVRSIGVHAAYRDAQDKFDHFVLGIIVAICAYLAQSIPFKPVGANVETMFLLSLLVFATSGFFGFKRIEYVVVSYRVNHVYLDAGEKGKTERANLASIQADKIAKKVYLYYKLRNSFFFSGFICYLAAKIFTGYTIA